MINHNSNKLLVLILALASVTLSHGPDCMHDALQTKPVTVPQVRVTPTKRTIPDTIYSQPMAFYTDYANVEDDDYSCYSVGDVIDYADDPSKSHTCEEEDILTSQGLRNIKDMMDIATELFGNTLSVLPIDGLNVKNDASAENRCDVKFSPVFDNLIPDVNFVIIVTARPISENSVLAYSTFCQEDDFKRPTVGVINFSPAKLRTGKLNFLSQVGVVTHELCHALGFSSSKFGAGGGFIEVNSDGTDYTDISPDDIKGTFNGPQGNSVTMITTDYVKLAARSHFDCDTLSGAELENDGATGAFTAHWEKRLFHNEFMTATETVIPIYSILTFALFEDMGWYKTYNTSYLSTLVWGRFMYSIPSLYY
eukprot:TRINITY_DN9219_c0_g1_i3.p1 TRINITY_DN9219_c0_g1~~TRINITY_DN9219_c0_g1_i3.p1  ORF type:complete len:366 (-),score=84.80 TRINITY_DN9219_c0_g1_i3:33-1130(-)